jgi:hypothetical protein
MILHIDLKQKMNIYKKIIFCLFVLTGIANNTLKAQVLPDVQNGFNQYNANTVQEKLFVHTDKSAYTAGELMWFKVYNVDGANHKPIDLSKVVYIEILDKNQNPVLQAKVGMKDGLGSGSLFLPISLTTGNFVLRAYTSWMKNFSPDFYFYKKLTIINPLKSPVAASKQIAANYDFQFFPEGGELVNGITSTVGFKATDQYGKGVNFKGIIIDKNNDTVAKFEPYKFGMGHFSFTPDSHNSYKAVIKLNDKILIENLPNISDKGYTLNVKDGDNNQLQVTVNTNLPDGNIFLFAHTKGVIKDVESGIVSSGKAIFAIDKNKLGDAISHITIFNSQRQPVCERLYFKRPVNQLFITAGTDAQQYATRKKVSININTKNSTNAVVANMSLSVYRLDSLQHASQQDIQNYLWLSSDLKGNIESPDYYFKNTDAAANEALDNLMLTQGWSRFAWTDILKNKKPEFKFLPEYNGPIVNAKITNTITNTPQNNMIAYLGIPGKRVQLYAAQSDTTGSLIFNMKDFYGPGEIVIETNTLHDTSIRIDVMNPFSDQYSKIKLPEFNLTPAMQSTIEDDNLSMQVQNIYNGEKLRQFYDPNVDSSAFYGTPFKTYLLDNYTRFLTVEEVMREYVSEVNITHTHNQFHIKVLNNNKYLDDGDPMVLIDGVPFFNIDKVFAADPLKIRKLEDVPFVYLLGPSYEAGIFSFTTYKGDMGGNEIDPHAVIMDYEGLEMQREFYSPAYDTEAAMASRMPDFRNVLYWTPNITTNKNGNSGLSFYTSDETGKYIGVIQGLTANGAAGSQYFTFDVTK